MTNFIISLRRSGALLLSVGTVSFLCGMGYGVVQSYPEPPAEPIIQPQSDIPTEPPPPNVTVQIKAVGDIIPGTNYPQNKLHPNKTVLFQAVQPSLQGADLLFGNYESTLTNYPYSAKSIGGLIIAFRTPPDYASLLKEVGFDIMSVANNHSYDFSRQGFADTINNLEQAGVKALGEKNQILYANINDLWIAWIGFSYFNYHNSLNDLPAAIALVEEASQNAHIVIISVHAGAEGTGAMHVRNQTEYFFGENRGNLVKFSQTMIDHGADLILGHGPHVPRALELYKGKLIAYSLGNFMGYRTLSTQAQLAYSLVLEVELDNQGDLVSGQIIPIMLNHQGIPYPDSQGRTIRLMRQLTQSDFPNTPLQIDSTGKIMPQ
ncbi:CapA family protein [Coleofasciculus sp.]|uniref:CapA family protein n=1 Tax=Coleofasciculus sp. TaxID=3100458 RepID=UPI003A3A2D67